MYLNIKNFFEKLVIPLSDNEDKARKEFILNIFLISIIFLSLFTFVINFTKGILGIEVPISAAMILAPLSFFILLYFLSRKGYINISSFYLLVMFFSLTTYMAYNWGIDLPTALLLYVLIIVMTGVLISSRTAFVVAIVSSLLIMTMGYFQNTGLIIVDRHWIFEIWNAPDFIVVSIIFFMIAIVSWLSNREVDKSLKRARKSEADLKIEKDSLKRKVQERTRELKQSQLEKTIQLQHFAEFGRMTSGLFHDIVNPLTALSLNLENLKKRVKNPEMSSQVGRALDRINRINRILISGRSQIQKEGVCTLFVPHEQIIMAIQMLSFKARKISLDINFIPLGETLKTYGDPIKFYRVATSLISNAIDAYAYEEVETLVPKGVIIKLYKEKNTLVFSVQDFGCGILQEHIEHIFDPLFTTKETKDGTGLGLTISREVIENDFGGNITVKSHEGEGTTFTIKFPMKENEKD